MDVRDCINNVLVKLFRKINSLEEKEICKDKFQNITLSEIHVLEAIGYDEPQNMSTVARVLDVTTGTLTIAVNSLVKKGLVERVRSTEDRRVVLVSLTDLGREAFIRHAQFHEKMVEAVTKELNASEIEALSSSLNRLQNFFDSIEQ